MKFCTDRHFIYLTTRANEHKEQLQSYYKLTEDDLEEITKYWLIDLLIPVDFDFIISTLNDGSLEIVEKQ
jgi:hypothetical protein